MRIISFYLIVAVALLAITAQAVDSSALTVKATGFYFTNSAPRLSLTIHLINTTNHDITVLTKQSSRLPTTLWVPINDTPEPKKLLCQIGLSETVTLGGHLVVPSLSDLAPVTLRPNEEAVVHLDIEQNAENRRALRLMTQDTEIIVRYTVTSQWGDRFACWSGSASSAPFKAKPVDMTPNKQ